MPSSSSIGREKDSRLLVWPKQPRTAPPVFVVPAATTDGYVGGKPQEQGPLPLRTPHTPLPPSPKGNLLSQNVVANDLAARAGFRDDYRAADRFKFKMYQVLDGLDSEQQFAIKSIFTDYRIPASKWIGLANAMAKQPQDKLEDAAARPRAWAAYFIKELFR